MPIQPFDLPRHSCHGPGHPPHNPLTKGLAPHFSGIPRQQEDPIAPFHFSPSHLAATLALSVTTGAIATLALLPQNMRRKLVERFTPGFLTSRLQQAVTHFQPFHAIVRAMAQKSPRLAGIAKVLGKVIAARVAIELVTLCVLSAAQIYRPKLSLPQVWQSAHQLGFTGKGMKIAVIDSGVLPTPRVPGHHVRHFDPKTLTETDHASDSQGHGSAVSGLYLQALPDAQILDYPALSKLNTPFPQAVIGAFQSMYRFATAQQPLDLVQAVASKSELLNQMGRCVRHSVDEGAQVINLSLASDRTLLDPYFGMATLALVPGYVANQLLYQTTRWIPGCTRMAEAANKRLKTLGYGLAQAKLFQQRALSPAEIQGLRGVLHEWYDALDYAHQKGVAVVLAAGNSGAAKTTRQAAPNALANQSLLGLTERQNYLVIGSANSKKQVSTFTSQWSADNPPDLAANGSGELSTDSRTSPSLLTRIFSPLNAWVSWLTYQNPPGTSFATPDAGITLAMVQQANPSLTVDQRYQILKQASHLEGVSVPGSKLLKGLSSTVNSEASLRTRIGKGVLSRQEAFQAALASGSMESTIRG